MRRIAVYFSDDILMEEIVNMARSQGFHVRHMNGMTVVDRVPGTLRKEHAKVVRPILKEVK